MYLNKIQELRGVAAILVTITHLNYSYNILPYFNSSIGVDIFFIISGFLMAYILENKKYTIRKFISRRIIRIYPLYLIFTLLVILLKVIHSLDFNLFEILKSLLFYPFSENQWNDLIIVPGWTLIFELFFYCIVIFKILNPLNGFKYMSITWITLIVLHNTINFNNETNILDIFFNTLNIEFIYGIISYYIYQNKFYSNKWVTKLLLYLSITILLILSLYSNDSLVYNLIPRDTIIFLGTSFPRYLIWGLPALIFFFSFLNLNLIFRRLEKVGMWSYSLYLLQFIYLGFLSKVFGILSVDINSISLIFKILLSIFSFCILLILSRYSYIYIELKIDRIIKDKLQLKK